MDQRDTPPSTPAPGTTGDVGEARPEMVLGLVAAPGAPRTLAGQLLDELASSLDTRLPGVRWTVQLVEDGLVQPPATDAELVSAGRRLLLHEGWDLAVCLTDLPLQVDRRPVVAHASALHGVALLSVPALGPVGARRRAVDAVLSSVEALLGATGSGTAPQTGRQHRVRLSRRARQLATDVEDGQSLLFTARVLGGNLRLLAGMTWANQPWRLAAHLSRALTAAVAAGVFALVTTDIWQLADAYGPGRLTAVAVAGAAALTLTLIVGARLWEHPTRRRVRQQVVLFNLATTATVVIGVLAFYAALFAVAFAAAQLLVVRALFAGQLGHPVGPADYARLAWLTSSLAVAGGALGAGLESDEAIREAAYTYRSSEAGQQDDREG